MMIVDVSTTGRRGLVMDSMMPLPADSGRLTVGDWGQMRRLLAMRADQGELSTVERRIADYLVEHGQLIRDQSSQQLATTLDVSQSSVVKFAKRLGFRGYPDMKLSISEALARAAARREHADVRTSDDPDVVRAESMARAKADAAEETRALNPSAAMADVARWILAADTVFVAGDGMDALAAQAFAGRLTLMGRRGVACLQPSGLRSSLCTAREHDLLIVISERAGGEGWADGCREARSAGGRSVVISRQRKGGLAVAADACLVVSAHATEDHLTDILYESAVRQLLDDILLRLFALDPAAAATFAGNRRRCLGGDGL